MLYDFPAVINQKILIYASIKFDMELICKIDANVTVSTPGTDIITLNHECNHHSNRRNPIDRCSEAAGRSTPDTFHLFIIHHNYLPQIRQKQI